MKTDGTNGKTKRKEKRKAQDTATRLFSKLQVRFTLLVSGLCSVLLAVGFVAAFLVNLFSMEIEIGDKLNRAVLLPLTNFSADEKPEEEGTIPQCTLAVIGTDAENVNYVTRIFAKYDYLTVEDVTSLVNECVLNDVHDIVFDGRKFRMRAEEIRLRDKAGMVCAIYDYTERHDMLIKQSILLVGAFVLLAVLFVVFSYLVSGRVLAPAYDALVKQKDLIANAGHELKTPVTIVNANLDALKSCVPPNEETEKWISNIESQTAHMSAMITELLEMSGFESAQYTPNITEFDLCELIEGVCLSFEAICFEKAITLEFASKEAVVVSSDEKSWSKLVNILLDNAVKYSDEKGKITVAVAISAKAGKGKKNRFVVLSVSNLGETVPPEELDLIFERFHKVGANPNSFGLGLALAKTICDNLGGKIVCESGEGRTTFTVTIPTLFDQT